LPLFSGRAKPEDAREELAKGASRPIPGKDTTRFRRGLPSGSQTSGGW